MALSQSFTSPKDTTAGDAGPSSGHARMRRQHAAAEADRQHLWQKVLTGSWCTAIARQSGCRMSDRW